METIPSQPLTANANPTPSPVIASVPTAGAALRRLMDEVRLEGTNGSPAAASYDRAHNRHNRS